MDILQGKQQEQSVEVGRKGCPWLGLGNSGLTLESTGRRSRCLGRGGGINSRKEEGPGEPEVGCRFPEGKAQRGKGLPGDSR